MKLLDAIKKFKELKVVRGEMEFSAGGDSMNDYSTILYDEKDAIVDDIELTSFIEDEIFKRVEFYVNSDGHYMGESGIVHITLCDDEQDFDFSKDAQAEFCEQVTSDLFIDLTEEQANFIRKNVFDINGGEGSDVNINYKRDFVMTDKDEEIQKSIIELIDDKTTNFVPDVDANCNDWFNFETPTETLINDNNQLLILITNEYYEYSESF